jgi:hypothetical protein
MEWLALIGLVLTLVLGVILKLRLDPNNEAFSCSDSDCDCNYKKISSIK